MTGKLWEVVGRECRSLKDGLVLGIGNKIDIIVDYLHKFSG